MSPRAFPLAGTARLIVPIILLSTAMSGCSKSDTPATLMAEAQRYEAQGDVKAAMIQLKNAAVQSPEDGEIRMRLAQVYLKSGDPVSAEKEARKAGDLKIADSRTVPVLTAALAQQGKAQKALDASSSMSQSKDSNLLAARGDALLDLNEREKARESYLAATAISPGQVAALLGLARLAALDKDMDAAAKLTAQAVAMNPTDPAPLYFKGMLLRSQGQEEQSIAAFDAAIKIKPSMSAALLERANAEMTLKKYDLARSDIEAARKIAPNNLAVYYAAAVMEFSQNNFKAANENIQKVLGKVPDHMPSVLLAGATELNLGSFQMAEQHLSGYLSAYPDNVFARKLLAQTQLRSAQPANAGATLAPLLQNGDSDVQVMALAGETSLRTRDFGKASKYFERATILDPKQASLRTSLGLSMLAEGKQEDGLRELQQAADQDPKSEQAGAALVRSELALKHYDKALKAAKDIVAVHPDNAELLNLEGSAYLASGNTVSARASFEKAVTLKPDFFSPVLNLAQLDLREKKADAAKTRLTAFAEKHKGSVPLQALAGLAASQQKPVEATTWLEKAVAENPGDVAASVQLIGQYLSTKQPQKAMNLARKVLAANPANLGLLDMLGQAQLAAGDDSGALDTYSKLVSAMPKSAAAHLRLAAIHEKLKNPAAASDDLRQVLALEPNNERALIGQIELAIFAKKTDDAMALTRAMQKKLPQSVLAQVAEGDILTLQKKNDAALVAYQRADAMLKNGAITLKVASGLSNVGKQKEAEAKLTGWVESHPGDVEPALYLSQLMLSRKDFKGASDRLARLLVERPDDAMIMNNLAWAYQQQKDPRALQIAERAVKVAPDSPPVLDTLGWMLVEQGNTARGLPLLQKAVSLDPQSGDTRYHLAAALAKSGDKKRARVELERALGGNAVFSQQEDAKALLKNL